MKKLVLAAGALLLASFPAAYAKSYEVILGNSVQAGNVELTPGTYRIRHKGDRAIFINLNTHRTYRVPATVEYMAQKNPTDQVVTVNNQYGQPVIQSVALGGHAIDLQFTE
ncbi:MAG TPA: hypothetical protein VME43_13365 [Bryobacteraceae bacterium]|nr:hypothetical protein [Bryobacteraceae bacterium]